MVLIGGADEVWEPTRFQTMTLQTLPNSHREKLKNYKFGRQTNYVNDIEVGRGGWVVAIMCLGSLIH